MEEHVRIKNAAKTELRTRSTVIANFLSAVIRGQRFRSGVVRERLEPVLNELVNERTNGPANTGELLSIALLNTAGEPVVSVGRAIDPKDIKEIIQDEEHWWPTQVGFVNLVEGVTNGTVILPSPGEFTNRLQQASAPSSNREPEPARPPPEPPPGGPGPEPRPENAIAGGTNFSDRAERRRDGEGRSRRPPWLRWMDEQAYEALIAKRELHGLVLVMSTDTLQAVSRHDLWLRCIITFFAGISAVGAGVAWRNLAESSKLQIRLVRASELNTHLKEMNLAAAGLAHETRNPLNIVRGLAQMISKRPDAPPEIRNKAREIIDETDKVTVQLNEFINYSRPRELRRSSLALNCGRRRSRPRPELRYPGETRFRWGSREKSLSIEADEQLLRQVLFNLVLNAIQAMGEGGEIQIVVQRRSASEASIEVKDNGPGVPPDRRTEIFKPYFTTQQKGTGLGLAIVQQIVLAHGWEIECLSNEPKGAIFRITHLKIAARH